MIIKLSILPLLIEGVFLPYDLEGLVIMLSDKLKDIWVT